MHHTSARSPIQTPVVVACCRTAIGRSHPERGLFRQVRGDELAAAVVKEVVNRSGVDPDTIEDLVLGATQQRGELGGNVARAVVLLAGLPFSVAGTTVNRLCGSSLQAFSQACHAIAAGAENVHVVGGVEHMHHLPMDSAIAIHPQAFARSSRGILSMGMTAEHLAAVNGISRRTQETYAVESHRKAALAFDHGLFEDEIVSVLGHDEGGAIVEVLEDQSVRNDTRVVGTAVVGVPPAMMGTGPVAAVRKLLTRTGIAIGDIDCIELNEAFAAQALYCIDELRLDPARVNTRGGSLAIGHPLGASGARILTTLIHAMRDGELSLGLATMCIGFGQGIAVLVERIKA